MTEQVLIDGQRSSLQSPKDIDDRDHSDSRIELLERNLRYIQQQHEVILIDLHNEINRLQQENQDLHYRLINTHSSSSSEQEPRNTNQLSTSTPDKPVDENHSHLEEKIDELEKQLIESEEKNISLIHKIDELNKLLSSKSEVSTTEDIKTSTQTVDHDYQHLLTISYEKQQEVTKLRSVLLEILNTERLSMASKLLLRDCLTSTNISDISMSKTTTTPIDMLFTNEKQHQQRQRFNASPLTNAKSFSFRQSNSQQRQMEQRANLPSIIQGNQSPLLQNSTYVNDTLYHSLSPTNYSQHQRLIKSGETPIARRERRTQELQKNRLTKNFYH